MIVSIFANLGQIDVIIAQSMKLMHVLLSQTNFKFPTRLVF